MHPDALGWVFLGVVAVLIVAFLASAFVVIDQHFRREEERWR